jgi:hypothetical protein
VAFNDISSPTNLIVIGLSWLILHNLRINWHTKSLHFNVPQKVTSKCEKFTFKNIINENEDCHLVELCTKFSKCDQYLGNAQDVKNSKALFVGTRSCMQTAKKGDAFLIYVPPTSDIKLLL